MKVLTIVPDWSIGGTQRAAQNLSISLVNQGISVAALAYEGGGPREHFLQDAGIPSYAPSETVKLSDAVTAASKWQPDIIHIHRAGYANEAETRLLRYLRDTTKAKIIEMNVLSRFDWSAGGQLIDAHCNLTKWCAYKWHAWGGHLARQKQSFILPNPLDIDSIRVYGDAERQTIRAKLGIPPGRFMFGRIGRPTMSKWSIVIVDAFERVARDHDVGLLLVAPPIEIIQAIEKLPNHIKERVIIRSWVSDDETLSQLFSVMDGFLHAAKIGESFGLVLCEAIMAGIPVITLATPLKDCGHLEVVGHGKGGLIVLNKRNMASAMVQLMQDKSLTARVKRDGRAWIADRYSLGIVARKAVRIYEKVLSGDQRTDPGDRPPDIAWIRKMLTDGIGEPPDFRTMLAFKMVHTPSIYQSYLAMKSWRHRLPIRPRESASYVAS